MTDAVVMATNKPGRIEVLVVTNPGGHWHAARRTPGGNWSPWSLRGMPGGRGTTNSGLDLTLVASNDGRLEAFASAQDGDLWHMRQSSVDASWANWESHGRPEGVDSIGSPRLVS